MWFCCLLTATEGTAEGKKLVLLPLRPLFMLLLRLTGSKGLLFAAFEKEDVKEVDRWSPPPLPPRLMIESSVGLFSNPLSLLLKMLMSRSTDFRSRELGTLLEVQTAAEVDCILAPSVSFGIAGGDEALSLLD